MTTEKTAPAGPVPPSRPLRMPRSTAVGAAGWSFLRDVAASSCSSRCWCRSWSRPSWCDRSTSPRVRWRTRSSSTTGSSSTRSRPGSAATSAATSSSSRIRAGGCRRAREPARPPIVEGDRLGALARRACRLPTATTISSSASSGCPGDHVVCCNALGQITVNDVPIDETDYVKLPDGESRGIRRSLRRRRARRQAVGARRQPLPVEGLALQHRSAGQGLRADRERRRPRVRDHVAARPVRRCSTSTTTCSPASPSPSQAGRRAVTVVEPRLTLERRLLREHPIVIACDEVGRGALAGPVAVGAVVIDAPRARKRIPQGLRDSKLVPEPQRAEVAARAASWVSASAVGWASSAEIDEIGIMRALGLADDPRARRSARARRRARRGDRAPRRQLRLHHARPARAGCASGR